MTFTNPSGFCIDPISCEVLIPSLFSWLGSLFGGSSDPPPPTGCLINGGAVQCYGAASSSKLYNIINDIIKLAELVKNPWSLVGTWSFGGSIGGGRTGLGSWCDTYCLSADDVAEQNNISIRVFIVIPWELPPRARTKPDEVSPEVAKQMKDDSPYTTIPVDDAIRITIDAVLANEVFRREARGIYRASEGKRELGALSVYEQNGNYFVFSVGKPSPEFASKMFISPVIDPVLGRHIFDWHPHPWTNSDPSPADPGTSFGRGAPSVVRFGPRSTNNTVFQGGCKISAEC